MAKKMGRPARNKEPATNQVNAHFTDEEMVALEELRNFYPTLSENSSSAEIVRAVVLDQARAITEGNLKLEEIDGMLVITRPAKPGETQRQRLITSMRNFQNEVNELRDVSIKKKSD